MIGMTSSRGALGLGVGLVEGAELAGLGVALVLGVEHARQGDVLAHDGRGHGLGEPLAHGERVAEHPRGVLEGLLGLDGPVGDDHGDAVVAVALGDVADHLGAAAVVEVDVEVGHRHALGVEEPLEDQAVLERVEVGDAHDVRGHRAGARAAAGADPDAVRLRPVDEVGDDEEVPRVALRGDDLDLVLGLLADDVRDAVRVPPVEADLDLLDEPGLLALPRRDREVRHVPADRLGEPDVAPLRDEERVVARLRQLAPDGAHLLRRLEVELVGVELEALGVGQRRPGLHAEQDGVGLRVLGPGVVQVVGRDQRQAEVHREAQKVLLDAALDAEAVVHQLAEEVALAEDVAELGGGLHGLLVLAEAQPGLDLARRAAGGRDEPLAVPVQQLAVHPGLVEVPLEAGQRRHPEEVVHAGRVLGQQRHVRVRAGARDVVPAAVAPPDAGAVLPGGAGRQVRLDADDRLDAVLLRLLPELVGAEDEAVVGRRDGRHAQPCGLGEEVVDPRRAVEHRVLGVHVEMCERRRAGTRRRA
jgi:hypothetical protein